MEFGNTIGKNFESYTPSFERDDEMLKSRENLNGLSEQVKGVETSEQITNTAVLSENMEILKVNKSLEEAKKTIDTGNLETKTAMELSSIFLNIPKLTHEEMIVFYKELPVIFGTFSGSSVAAGELLVKEVRSIEEVNVEKDKAANINEFNNALNKEKKVRAEMEDSIYGMINYAKSAETKWNNNISNK